jgi:ABC-type uncharacterized transport system permease subunit
MLRLEPRREPSLAMFYFTPFLAVLLALAGGAVLFAFLGKPPLDTLRMIFIQPLTSPRGVSELLVKGTPLILIAIGLAMGFRGGIWNIGAEGQFTIGALTGGSVALAVYPEAGFWLLPAMALAGTLGGMAWAAIPALGGFSESRLVWLSFLISGGCAGLAGLFEAAGPVGQLVPALPVGYGFTAIIVAFLGRLHPGGIVLAGLLLALTYIGGETAQIALSLPSATIGVFQGMFLFFMLGTDALVNYRPRWVPRRAAAAAAPQEPAMHAVPAHSAE